MITGDAAGLRAIEREDLEALRTWRNRPALRRYFREHREITRADQEAWFERMVSDNRNLMFAVVDIDLDPPPLMGAAGLCYVDWVRRSAELSLYIGADDVYIDDRLAPDVLRLLVSHGFEDLGLHRLWTEVYDLDERKAALLQQFGFQLEGRHRDSHFADGEWHDSLYFGLLEDEWRERSPSAG